MWNNNDKWKLKVPEFWEMRRGASQGPSDERWASDRSIEEEEEEKSVRFTTSSC